MKTSAVIASLAIAAAIGTSVAPASAQDSGNQTRAWNCAAYSADGTTSGHMQVFAENRQSAEDLYWDRIAGGAYSIDAELRCEPA